MEIGGERGGEWRKGCFMFGTTCVFMKLMECTGVGEGLNLVRGHG